MRTNDAAPKGEMVAGGETFDTALVRGARFEFSQEPLKAS